jgi:hypothetical protein
MGVWPAIPDETFVPVVPGPFAIPYVLYAVGDGSVDSHALPSDVKFADTYMDPWFKTRQ